MSLMPHDAGWEWLSRALERVMTTGAAEVTAKRAICNEIADRKIQLRACFMRRRTFEDFLTRRDKPTREIRYVEKVQIPGIHLSRAISIGSDHGSGSQGFGILQVRPIPLRKLETG